LEGKTIKPTIVGAKRSEAQIGSANSSGYYAILYVADNSSSLISPSVFIEKFWGFQSDFQPVKAR
jgi:hypothetical protein